MFGGSGGDLKRKIYRNRKREMMKSDEEVDKEVQGERREKQRDNKKEENRKGKRKKKKKEEARGKGSMEREDAEK